MEKCKNCQGHTTNDFTDSADYLKEHSLNYFSSDKNKIIFFRDEDIRTLSREEGIIYVNNFILPISNKTVKIASSTDSKSYIRIFYSRAKSKKISLHKKNKQYIPKSYERIEIFIPAKVRSEYFI